MADTSYLIHIAADFGSAADASSQLTELADRLTGAGAGAQALDAAMAVAESALGEAGAAAARAASDLSDGETRYRELEVAADRAAKALERAGLKTTGAVPADLKSKADAATAALTKHAAVLDDLKGKAAAAAAAEKRLGGAFSNLQSASKKSHAAQALAAKQAGGTGVKLEELGELFGRLGGKAGGAGQKVTDLAGSFGKLKQGLSGGGGAAALLALVAAVTIAAAAGLVKVGVGLANARRNAALATEALEQTSDRLVGLGAAMPEVVAASGLAVDEIRDLAKQLDGAKVSAADMPRALRAVAIAEEALGKGGAAELIQQLKDGKKSVDELAREVERKFDGIVARKLMSLESQAERLKRGLGETFGGIKIEGFLSGMSKLVDLFDQNTAAGKALSFLFEKMVQPLVDAVTAAFPVVERFFLGMIIGALKIYIALKPVVRFVEELFGKEPGDGLESALETAETLGKAVATVLFVAGAAAAFVASRFISMGSTIMGIFETTYSVIATILNGIYTIVMGVVGTIVGAIGLLIGNADMIRFGEDMVTGLANGIVSAGGAVLDAITGVVGDAVAKAKSLLGIASPSKVFAAMGKQTSEGFSGGVEAGAPAARTALESLVEPPPAAKVGGAAVAGPSANFAGATFHFHGPIENVDQAEARFGDLLTRVFEGDALQFGAGTLGAT